MLPKWFSDLILLQISSWYVDSIDQPNRVAVLNHGSLRLIVQIKLFDEVEKLSNILNLFEKN